MASQSELIANNRAVTPKQFVFALYDGTQGVLVLDHVPDGWDDDEYQMTRDMKSFGVFRKYTVGLMKFVMEGRDYLQTTYETEGINAYCTFSVTEIMYDGSIRGRFVGNIDFSTYRITELSVDVQIIDGAFTDIVLTRAKIPVNLLGVKSIDGDTLSALSLQTVVIPEIHIDQAGSMMRRDVGAITETHCLQTLVVNSEFEELTDSIGLFTHFFQGSTQEYIGLQFTFDVQCEIEGTGDFEWNFDIEVWETPIVLDSVIYSESYVGTHGGPRSFQMSGTLALNLDVGYELAFRATLIGTGTSSITYSVVNYNLLLLAESIPSRNIAAILFHEAFDRLIQHYTGLAGRFKSDFLGRTDIGYLADGTAMGVVTAGRYIRQKTSYNNTIPVSLEGLFGSLQAMWCLGMGVETIDDVEKVVIEPMSHFFNNTVIIDLSARIEPETIEKRVDTEFIFNTIKIGYNSFDYGKLGGIFEYNVANNYTTTIKPVSKQLKILSDYRSDISGVILLEKEPVENRDAAGEGNIFILDSVRNGGSNWIVRTVEGFENSSNLGNLDVLINVLLSPARNIRRWGAYIRGFLNKYVTTDLIWQTSGKNTMLSSTLTDEATIVENANIPVEELDTPFWHPETFTVEVPASNADIEAIKANPYGLVKLTADEYGYILDYKSKNENKKSTFKLLRCNTQYLSPSDQPFPGSVVITKVITGLPSDMKSFGVTITESTTGVSYITKISQFAPVTVLLPYGSYTIVELPRIGYTTGISVVPDTIILNGDNPSEAILITNEKN